MNPSTKEIVLAMITGAECMEKPYAIQSDMPMLKNINITIDTSRADLVFHIFNTWGTKDIVVKVPAI